MLNRCSQVSPSNVMQHWDHICANPDLSDQTAGVCQLPKKHICLQTWTHVDICAWSEHRKARTGVKRATFVLLCRNQHSPSHHVMSLGAKGREGALCIELMNTEDVQARKNQMSQDHGVLLQRRNEIFSTNPSLLWLLNHTSYQQQDPDRCAVLTWNNRATWKRLQIPGAGVPCLAFLGHLCSLFSGHIDPEHDAQPLRSWRKILGTLCSVGLSHCIHVKCLEKQRQTEELAQQHIRK